MKKQPQDSNAKDHVLGRTPMPEAEARLDVSDSDTSRAWETFVSKVQKEAVPEFWTREEADDFKRPSLTESGLKPSPFSAEGQPSLKPAATELPNRKNKALRRWTSLAAAAAIAGTLLFTPVGSDALASLLQTFRVQHLNTVSVSMEDLNRLSRSLAQGSVDPTSFNLNQYGEVTQQGGGTIRTVTAADASRSAGYPLKLLPGIAEAATDIEMLPQLKLVFQLHAEPINKLIAQLGGKSKLPASVEGQPIAIEIPTLVRLAPKGGSGKELYQLQAPSLNVADGINVDQVRQAILDLPLLPEDLRAKLAGIEDWRHTLPLPTMNDSSVQTTISGREAVLSSTGYVRTLIWLDDGRVFCLSGTQTDYATNDAIIAEAKEIIGS